MKRTEWKILVAMPEGDVRDSFFTREAIEAAEALGSVKWNGLGRHYTPEELRDALEVIDVCFTGWGVPRLTGHVLEKAKQLKVLAHTGGSVANICSVELYQAGVRVISGNDIYAKSVAEGVISYMLCALRRLPDYLAMTRDQGWHSGTWYNEGLLGQSLGLVGFGAISRYLLQMLKPFDMRVKVYSRYMSEEEAADLGVQKAGLEEIFDTCKIVSIHSANTPQNHHLINQGLLKRLQPGALFVNTARGMIVDEAALAEELKTGRFRAFLDVYQTEPLPGDSPLRSLENVYLMPHMAGPTIDRRPAVVKGLADDIASLMAGGGMDLEISEKRAAQMSQ